jgi:hypothetical protein
LRGRIRTDEHCGHHWKNFLFHCSASPRFWKLASKNIAKARKTVSERE